MPKRQFEGKLTYGTACKGCKFQSERESDFLELELNLEVSIDFIDSN